MATLAKQEMVAALNEKFSKATGVVQAEYRGISADTMTTLRSNLRAENVELYVVKNRLAKIAAKGTPVEELSNSFTGPTSLAISYDNATAPARLLSDFGKQEQLLKIIAGMAEGDVFDAAGVKAIGKLPPKPVLLSSYLSVMQGPTRSLVYVISGVLKQFMYLLNATKEQRENNPDFKEGEEMADVSAEDVKSYLNGLSVLKLVELTKELEEEWGVSAAAPVAVAAAPAAGGEAAAEEKTSFTVNLTAIGDKKIQVIKAVREATGLGLKDAKAIVDAAPKAVKENIAKDEAEALKKLLEEAGASVELV